MGIEGVFRILRFRREKIVDLQPDRLQISIRVHDLHLDHKHIDVDRLAVPTSVS